MKLDFYLFFGLLGGAVSVVFGNLDTPIITMCTCMAVDYITGLVCAGIFKKSSKTKGGSLNSSVGFRGLFKKGIMLLIVAVANMLDKMLETEFIRYGTVVAFTANEIISIIENAGLMGIPLPAPIIKAVEILKEKGGE